jgi:hypothetical protein
MARPGLEPGTPRFSDSCTERSNARESPATAQLPAHTARTAKSASCMKLREMLDASCRSCPNRPAAAMPAAARARTPRPTRDSRRRHCSRSARLELRSCSSRASVWSLSTEMPACPPERERWSCRGIVPLGPIWRSGLRCWFAWIRRSARRCCGITDFRSERAPIARRAVAARPERASQAPTRDARYAWRLTSEYRRILIPERPPPAARDAVAQGVPKDHGGTERERPWRWPTPRRRLRRSVASAARAGSAAPGPAARAALRRRGSPRAGRAAHAVGCCPSVRG